MIAALLTAGLLVALPGPEVHHYALIIGNNAPLATGDEELPMLRYADDDAAAFAEFMATLGADVTLLSVLDAPTQIRFPELAAHAAPPTKVRLLAAVAALEGKLKTDAAHGRRTALWIFFSGHGQLTAAHEPALALLDAGLTQTLLYSMLEHLPADVVHLFVDACHAEAVVRAREVPERSQSVATSAEDLEAFASKRSLQRFPHVGAVIATAVDQPAHEWDTYENGIFTHQLLSALRGGADVNGDERIEYSELHAFLAAANREIRDPRAKLSVLVKAPPIDQRTVLVDLRQLLNVGFATASGAQKSRFWIEDGRGVRLADVNLEAKHRVVLALPTRSELFLRESAGEASFSLAVHERLDLGKLAMKPPSLAARGAISSALTRGLFAAAYGPSYYRGFVDSSGDLPVDFAADWVSAPPSTSSISIKKQAAIGLWIGAAVGTAVALTLGGITLDAAHTYNTTPSDTVAAEARDRYNSAGIGCLVTSALTLTSAAIGLALFPWHPTVLPTVGSDRHGLSLGAAGHF